MNLVRGVKLSEIIDRKLLNSNTGYVHPLEQITDHYEELYTVIRLARPEELRHMIENIDQIKIEMERQLLLMS
jgi:hypothetical protein